MITFYFKALKEIISKLDLQKTFFIIPNKRSKALLKNNIIDLINKPTIAPIILSIDDFTEQVSGLKESSRTNQIFDLFESYLKISDQNDIQCHLVQSEKKKPAHRFHNYYFDPAPMTPM